MTKRFRFVAEITLTVDDAGTQGTFYFSTSGFTTKPTDTPANTVVEEWLEDPGTLRRELFSGARISGPVRPSFGQIVLSNHSGVLDDWTGYGISGGRVVVRYGEEGAAYPAAYSTVYVAFAYSLIVDFDRVRVLLRDLLYKLEEPVVRDVFSGNGGLEGTGIAKKKKQLAFGRPGFIPVTLVDQQRQIYFVQSNAADERAFRQTNPPLYLPFEGGRGGINFAGYYESEDALLNDTSPDPGEYKIFGPGVDGLTPQTTESTGPIYFRLGSPPEYELRFPTLGLLKNGAGEFSRAWRFTDLLTRAGVPAELAPGSYQKNVGNYLCDADQSYLDVMTDACAASFSAYGFDRLGRFFTLDLQDPTEGVDSSVFTFDLNNSRDIRRQPVPGGEAPIWQVSVSVGRTWPTSSLRTSLDAEERELFERSPWQAEFTGTSAAVRLANPGAESATVEIQGNELQSISSKFQYVQRFIYLFGSRRELITLTTQLTAETMALDLHQLVTLRMPRFGCESGRLFRIITLDLNCRARTVTVSLWGGPFGPDDAILGGGSQTPGGGTGEVGVISGAGDMGYFTNLFYGRAIGGGGGGQTTFAEFTQTFIGRNVGVLEAKWDSATVSSPHVLSDGDRRLTQPVSNTTIAQTVRATRGMSSGKWYWEIIVVSTWPLAGGTTMIGMVDSTQGPNTNLFNGTTANSFGWVKTVPGAFWRNGSAFAGGRQTFEGGVTTCAFAFDADTGDLWVGSKATANPTDPITWQSGTPGVGPSDCTGLSLSETYYPAACPWSSSASSEVILDIRGLGNLDQAPPAGFTAYSA